MYGYIKLLALICLEIHRVHALLVPAWIYKVEE
jgi:hypothetical protein